MKRIHIPTLVMHLLLILLARFTIGDYPDFFLGFSILVLLIHTGWAIVSKQNLLPAHCLGSSLYLLAEPLGIVTIGSGFWGMGSGFWGMGSGFWGMGSDFGWLFYGFALIISLALETVIAIVRFCRSQPK